MAIFVKRSLDKSKYTEEDLQLLVETLTGFQGTPSSSIESIEAIKNTDVFKAVTMIASDLAKMDITVRDNGVVDESHDLAFLLNKHPNKAYNGYKLKFMLFANALLNKNSYVEVIRQNGKPYELKHIAPSKVSIDDTGTYLKYKILENGRERHVNYYDMINLSFYTLDGFGGLSIIEVLSQVINTDKEGKSFLYNFLKNGTHAGGILKLEGAALNQKARDKAREKFQETMSGSNQAGKVLVLDKTMDYQQLEVDTEVLKLIQNSKPSTSEVAKAFGIPLHKFGIETTNIDINEANTDYLSNTLGPYMKAVTSELEFQLFTKEENRRYSLAFDVNKIKVLDPSAQSIVDARLLRDGILTLDEVRLSRGLQPVPGGYGSKHRVSLNNVSIDLVDDYQQATMSGRMGNVAEVEDLMPNESGVDDDET